MYFFVFESNAFDNYYHFFLMGCLNPPLAPLYLHDFCTAEEIGQLMGGN